MLLFQKENPTNKTTQKPHQEMFRLYLFTRICLLELVPSVKCPFLLFTQVWPLLQQPMGDPALTDPCEKRRTKQTNKLSMVYILMKGVVLQSPGTHNVLITGKVRVQASLLAPNCFNSSLLLFPTVAKVHPGISTINPQAKRVQTGKPNLSLTWIPQKFHNA